MTDNAKKNEDTHTLTAGQMIETRRAALTAAVEIGRVSGRLAKSDFEVEDTLMAADDLYLWLLGGDPFAVEPDEDAEHGPVEPLKH